MLKAEYGLNAFQAPFSGFGDLWAIANYLLGLPDQCMLNRHYRKLDIGDTIESINNVLDTTKRIKLVVNNPARKIPIIDCFKCHYLSTKVRWTNPKNKKICYQFDGRSGSKYKNLSLQDELELTNKLKEQFDLINVGGMMPIKQIIYHLSDSEAFVGIPSGITHVANSVGVPSMIVLTSTMLKKFDFDRYIKWHYGNKPDMVFYRDVYSLIKHDCFIEEFNQNRRKLIDLTEQ